MQTYLRVLGNVRRLTSSVVIKKAPTEYLQREAEALHFISRNTTIPVPIVYDLRPASEAGRSHLFLQFMEGEMLARKWRVITPAQKRVVMGKTSRVRWAAEESSAIVTRWLDRILIRERKSRCTYQHHKVIWSLRGRTSIQRLRISTFDLFGQEHEPTARWLQEKCPTTIEFISPMVISRYLICCWRYTERERTMFRWLLFGLGAGRMETRILGGS